MGLTQHQLHGTNLAVNLRLNTGLSILYGTNLAVKLWLTRTGLSILHGTNLAINLRQEKMVS